MGREEVLLVFKKYPDRFFTSKDVCEVLCEEFQINIGFRSIKQTINSMINYELKKQEGYSIERNGQKGYFYKLNEDEI